MPTDQPLWELTEHCCRVCFGRILRQAGAGQASHSHRYRCSNCGLQADGAKPAVLCSCGMKLKGGRGAGILRCERNPDPRPEFPSEVVALQVTS